MVDIISLEKEGGVLLRQGDALQLLKELPDESVDAIVSDPPYSLFNKQFEWDVLPSVEVLKEALRVLKSGAFALWMMTPKQDNQLEFLLRLRQAGFVISFTPIFWVYANGFPKAMNISKVIDKKLGVKLVKENEAKVFSGAYAGFQPKPAVEVVIVSMKPLSEKTYVGQTLKNGKGVTWLDDGRIPISNDKEVKSKGRFLANLLVSDNVLDNGKITRGRRELKYPDKGGSGNSLTFIHKKIEMRGYNDLGQFSRYFSLDRWYEVNIEKLPKEQRDIFPFLNIPKPSRSERGNENSGSGGNIHPTVKPEKLMTYLIIIITREGDIVLDPFMGSGTTGVASVKLKRKFIGFEIMEEYFEIAQKRIGEAQKQRGMLDGEFSGGKSE